MSKITKKQRIKLLETGISTNWSDMKKIETRLNRELTGVSHRLEALEEFATYADNLLTELSHALPYPDYDAMSEEDEADLDASLDRHRERLGLNKPQLRTLDQSIFDGLDEKWQWAAVDGCTGRAYVYEQKPHFFSNKDYWRVHDGLQCITGTGYDSTDWQNSLIERDDIAKELAEVDLSGELTGSELCRAMLERGDKWVVCMVANNPHNIMLATRPVLVFEYADSVFKTATGQYEYAVPVDINGNEITQLPDADLKPGDVLLREDWHDYFEEGARYIITDDLRVKDLQGDEWSFLRKNKDLYVFGLDDAITACFVKAEDAVHG